VSARRDATVNSEIAADADRKSRSARAGARAVGHAARCRRGVAQASSASDSASGDAWSARTLATSGSAAGAGSTSRATRRPFARSSRITASGSGATPKPARARSIIAASDEKKFTRRFGQPDAPCAIAR
jgi:hypothetical protein